MCQRPMWHLALVGAGYGTSASSRFTQCDGTAMCWWLHRLHVESSVSSQHWWSNYWQINMTPTAFGAYRESRLMQMSALPGLCVHRHEAGLGRYRSALAKETDQCLQLGRGGRERTLRGERWWHIFLGCLPLRSRWDQNRQAFSWWIFPSPPTPSRLLCFLEPKQVWGPGAGPATFVVSCDFYSHGLADLEFLQVCSVRCHAWCSFAQPWHC